MTTALIRKNIKLSHEFDTFVSTHPRTLRSLSGGVNVVLTSASDPKLSEANVSVARSSRSGKFIEAHKTDGTWKIRTFRK